MLDSTSNPAKSRLWRRIFQGHSLKRFLRRKGSLRRPCLRPLDGGEYLLSIAFDTQELQQKWVATELHGRMWPMMEAHFSGYTLKTYTAV